MTDDLERRRRAVHKRLDAVIEECLDEVWQIDQADPDLEDYPRGVLTGWALVFEKRTYDASDSVGATQHGALAREDQSMLLTAALGRRLMLDREATLHDRPTD